MIKVNNKDAIHNLTKHFLKINRNRNIVAILAIVITSILFTSIFTASISVVKSTMQSEMRKTMDKSHATAENLTREQYEKLSKDSAIKKLGLSIFLTLAENKDLSRIQTEIRYADQNAADSFMALPSTGRLPEKEDELATSTIVLDALGVDHKLGEKIHLTYTLDGKTINKDFKLSGYWSGDAVAMAQLAWVSKTYCDRVAPKATEERIENGCYEVAYNLFFWFPNIINLDKKVWNLSEKYGLKDSNVKLSANPAYNIFDSDAFPFETMFILIMIILLSGYLIIYNVINISVNIDIRAYGLLKNIGTTGRQLKKIVRLQALWLSTVGIPIGMIIGFLIGKSMTPFLLSNLGDNSDKVIQTSVSVNPVIFVVSAMFSLAVIYAGCIKPCKVVGKLSPIEAVRMADSCGHKKTKKSKNVTAFSMAASNVKRNLHKSMAVMISLTLSLVLLNMVYMIVKGFDFNAYTSNMISGDEELNGNAVLREYANLHIITPEVKKELEANKDIASAGYVYFTTRTHKVDDILYGSIKQAVKHMGGLNFFSKSNQEEIKSILKKREVEIQIVGINEAAFHKLNFGKESCTWKDFASGKYIITNAMSFPNSYYSVGDKVTVDFNDKNKKAYKVIAYANLPFTLGYQYIDGCIQVTLFLPEKEYIKETGDYNAMSAVIDAKKGKLKAVADWVNEYNKKKNECFNVNSRYEIKKQFESYVNKYYMIGGMLTAVLFIVAIMNFFNTSAASIQSRKKELSLLEAVGMTKRQIFTMLSFEGFHYIIGAYLLTITVGILIADKLVNMIVGKIYFFQCRGSFLPSTIVLPFLIIIVFMILVYNYRRMCRESVVERIRKQ